MVQGPQLLVHAAVAIVVLVLLIARFKLNPFVTLVVVSLALGVSVGMPMGGIVKAFETGVGNTLGHIALVVALGEDRNGSAHDGRRSQPRADAGNRSVKRQGLP